MRIIKRAKVLLKNAWNTKLKQDIYLGPYTILPVRNNGTVRDHKDEVSDIFNICIITPYNSIMGKYDIHKYTQLYDQVKNMS